MNVIVPIQITDAMLTSTSIPELDVSEGESEWLPGTTYNLGDFVAIAANHQIYQSLSDGNVGNDPASDDVNWNSVYPTNRWAMFDTVNGTTSDGASPITIRVTPGSIVNGVAAFNVKGASAITIIMVDPEAGEVYRNELSMEDDQEVTDWWQWTYADIEDINEFVDPKLPAYPNAYIEVIFEGVGNISIGTLLFGRLFELGQTVYGTSVQMLDFSQKDTDDFGNFTITKRRNSKLVDFDAFVPSERISYTFRKLRSLTTVPCVWYATGTLPTRDPTIVYGYHRDSRINWDNPSTSSVTIQIEGLV